MTDKHYIPWQPEYIPPLMNTPLRKLLYRCGLRPVVNKTTKLSDGVWEINRPFDEPGSRP